MPSVSMSSLWLKRLQPKTATQIDYFDQKQSGLGLRVGKTGTMTWFAMYRVKGDRKKRRYTIGRYPTISLSDAREEARKLLVDVDKGNDPAEEKKELLTAPTFQDLATEYLAKHATQKRSGREDERILKKDLLPTFGRFKAHDIKRRDVIRLLDEIVDRGAPIQANRTLALIRKIFNWAIGRDLVEVNPCNQIKAPSKENRRERVLSESDINAVWVAFEKQKPPVCAMFKLRLLTAQRGGEVESMRWQDIDLEKGWWTIPPERSKNGLSHRVPLARAAVDILKSLGQKKKWVFPSPHHNGTYIANVQKAGVRVREESGVKDFKLHDMRRTAASYMTSMGISRLVVSKILNHAEHDVTSVYDRHSYDMEKRAALDKWAGRLEQILTGEKGKVVPFSQSGGR